MSTAKEVGRFLLGVTFLVTCIPPAVIIAGIWLCTGGAHADADD